MARGDPDPQRRRAAGGLQRRIQVHRLTVNSGVDRCRASTSSRRLDWQQRASVIGAYRELYGARNQADPVGPEPAGSSPEQRAAWHAGFAALTRTDTVDVRALPEASVWHMRDTYKAETEWAPPQVGRQLRGVRLAAEDRRQLAIRSQAEARAATDPDTAERHSRMAASAEALQHAYRRIESSLGEAMDDRQAWEQITAGPRRLAVAADSELRRRNPDQLIEPLRSAEPRAPEFDEITNGNTPAPSRSAWLAKPTSTNLHALDVGGPPRSPGPEPGSADRAAAAWLDLQITQIGAMASHGNHNQSAAPDGGSVRA